MISDDVVKLSRAARERLYRDHDLVDLLLDAGLNMVDIENLIESLSGLVYGVWGDVKISIEKRQQSQKKVVKKAQALIDELSKDELLNYITVEDPEVRRFGAFADGKEPQRAWLKAEAERVGGSQMRLVHYLTGLVESIEAGQLIPFSHYHYSGDVSERGPNRFRNFSIRIVYRALQAQADRIGKKHLKYQNKLTACFVSSLLDEPVTGNDVTKARDTERDRYWKD